MGLHYNAFISYRHHPDDMRVAADIHRSLERFYVPRSIRKRVGTIKRLFRDKEELPITSSLSDDIGEALKNSDYLIVICSVHTKESIWVQREIELFLKSHDRSKVLTVLASGEPYDVIPDILLYEDVVDPVTGQVCRTEFEPLSCDWRIKRKQAVREELPRLAATLLGCAYDELRQRQRQYRARRNMAIISGALAASLCLSAYFLYTSITIQRANVQIKKANEEIRAVNEEIQAANEEIKAANVRIQANLDQALINQSRHLATAAQERLAEGDRLMAISLAAAALPSGNNVRPYVTEAENVLISALGIYNSNPYRVAVGTVSPGANITVDAFTVTQDETTIYLHDSRNLITAWDTQTLQKTGQIQMSKKPAKMITTPNNSLVVQAGGSLQELSCYQPDGTLLWRMERVVDVVCLEGTDQLLVICRTAEGDGYGLQRVDGISGQPLQTICTLDDLVPGVAPSSILCSVAENVPCVVRFFDKGECTYFAIDPLNGTCREITLETDDLEARLTTRDGKLFLLGGGTSTGLVGSAMVEGDRINAPGTANIYCYDLYTGKLLWKNQTTKFVVANGSLHEIPGERVLCNWGNVFTVLDKNSGEILANCEAGSGILSVTVGEKWATAVLQDGYTCNYWYDNNYCYEVKCMKNGVVAAYAGESCFSLHRQEDHVTVYRSVTGMPAWTVELEKYPYSLSNYCTWNQLLAFCDNQRMGLFDSESRSILWDTEKGNKLLLGFSRDGKTLYYAEGKETITAVEISTGSSQALPVTADGETVHSNLFYDADRLYYVAGDAEKPKLVIWDLKTGEKKDCLMQLDAYSNISAWRGNPLAATEGYVWLLDNKQALLEVDTATGSIQKVLEDAERPIATALQENRKIAFTHKGNIYIKTPGKPEVVEIIPENAYAGSVFFAQDHLLALCDNGFLYRFDESGQELSRTQLEVDIYFANKLSGDYHDRSGLSWKVTESGDLVINVFGYGNVIDCESWALKASISNLLMYDGQVLLCKQGSNMAGYPIYDLQQLLEIAGDVLNGFQLSQEQKVAYGID